MALQKHTTMCVVCLLGVHKFLSLFTLVMCFLSMEDSKLIGNSPLLLTRDFSLLVKV